MFTGGWPLITKFKFLSTLQNNNDLQFDDILCFNSNFTLKVIKFKN